jgi:ABC-type sugar transport system ATPase subunit
MDEPTSALSGHEIDILFTLIRSLKEQGAAIIYITHKLGELFRIANRLTILRDGHLIDTYEWSPAATSKRPS